MLYPHIEVVSERLGHANIALTMQTYERVLPGMQADAARTTERLVRAVPPAADDTVGRRRNSRKTSAWPAGAIQQRGRPRSLTWAFTCHMVAGAGLCTCDLPVMRFRAGRAIALAGAMRSVGPNGSVAVRSERLPD
jgi:hypothetical protein